MKKLINILIVSTLLLLAACASKRNPELVGTWQDAEAPEFHINFAKDGSYFLGINEEVIEKGKWKTSREGEIIAVQSAEQNGTETKATYAIKDDTLAVIKPDLSGLTLYKKRANKSE